VSQTDTRLQRGDTHPLMQAIRRMIEAISGVSML
jgi:hypothetical protein